MHTNCTSRKSFHFELCDRKSDRDRRGLVSFKAIFTAIIFSLNPIRTSTDGFPNVAIYKTEANNNINNYQCDSQIYNFKYLY